MYSDKVEVLRFETEPYRKPVDQNGTINKNGSLHYMTQQCMHINNNHINNGIPKHFNYHNGYHTALIETNTKSSSPVTAPTIVPSLNHNVQPPSDPIIASVLHPRQNARPGRLLLENVNNRPQTMDRGTQANTDDVQDDVSDRHSVTVITEAPSTSHNDPVMNDLYRNANISVSEKKLLTKGGDDSSVDSLNSADSAKQDSEDSVIERVEFQQPMITKDDTDGHIMSNGNGKYSGAGGKIVNCADKEHPVDEDANITSCGMECLYFAMQCCECSIM